MSEKNKQPATERLDYDPRPVSDHRVREQVSREDVERWREEANTSHRGWIDVMNNPYGKD